MPWSARVAALMFATAAACGGAGEPKKRIAADLVRLPALPIGDEGFASPERGFYTSIDLLREADLSRALVAGNTLVHSPFRLDDYRERPLSPELLEAVATAFARAREAGVKVIPRFSYNAGPFPRSEPDASEAQIRAHLEQLRPVFEANADVLFALEAGFVGAWGEWHSSTHGLDDDLATKRRLLEAILTVVPSTRMVALRFPSDIEQLVGPLPDGAALSGSFAARVGSHQDCFLGSEDDFGTWGRGGKSPEDDKDFIAARGRYVVVGGETCAPSGRSSCETAADELRRLRFSYLNEDFHPDVIAGFVRDGCFEDFERRLGYRLAIRQAGYRMRGDRFHFEAVIDNAGFAAPVNPREVFLVFEDGVRRIDVPLRADPRRWLPGDTLVVEDLPLPADLASGTYRLSLWLPDPAPTLKGRPAYAIRLANRESWQADSGLNWLADEVRVARAGGGGVGGDTVVVDDFDRAWPSANDLALWSGGNGFAEGPGGAGVTVDGALRLRFAGTGWFATDLPADVARYRHLIVRVRGRDGGEERRIGVRLGAVDAPLAEIADGEIGRDYGELRIDLRRVGLGPGKAQLQLYFWKGGSGQVEIDRIWLER